MEHRRTALIRLLRATGGLWPVIGVSALLLVSLALLVAGVENTATSGRLFSMVIAASLVAITALGVLITVSLVGLFRQIRRGVTGTGLTLRMVALFAVLSIIPAGTIFAVSLYTLHRGIDSWFDVRIEQALNDALALGRTAVDAIKLDLVRSATELGGELESQGLDNDIADPAVLALLGDYREQTGATEVALYGPRGEVIAASSSVLLGASSLLPTRPNADWLARARGGEPWAGFDAAAGADLRLGAAIPVRPHTGADIYVLHVSRPLPPRHARLGESVESAYTEYRKLVFLRGPLKFGFSLTLSLVALLAFLASFWAAVVFSRRLTRPIEQLADATREIARGDYRHRVPEAGHDELGVLVRSFNEMTRRIRRASSQLQRHQRDSELRRAWLETVLAHLSSGVFSFNAHGRLRTLNAAAKQITGIDHARALRRLPAELTETWPELEPLFSTVVTLTQANPDDRAAFRSEVTVTIHGRPRRLLVRASTLPGLFGRRAGWVVVFDDITALIEAQRDAAWREVARRMAHEIRNPLTPIQLSAERIRHKVAPMLKDDDRAMLERSTRTIVEQVESLKAMVSDFSEYARVEAMRVEAIDLNELIRDVVELHRGDDLDVDLDPQVRRISGDRGRLRQVLHNLILNAREALKATPAPRILVQSRPGGDAHPGQISLAVTDNGPGFPEDLIPRLFEPYVTTRARGTGLGLAIVKRIVEDHGGSVTAGNLPEGGACVTVSLPSARTV